MPDVSAVTDRIKSIPPVAWLIGGAIVIAVIVLSHKGGSSAGSSGVIGAGSASDSGGGGSSGGDSSPDLGGQITSLADELHQAEADLAASVAAQTANNAEFQQSVLDTINQGGTPGPAGPAGPAGPPGPAGGGTAPSIYHGLRLTLTGRTNLFSTKGKLIGAGTSGTYNATIVKIGSKSFYRIKRSGEWKLIPTNAKTIIVKKV